MAAEMVTQMLGAVGAAGMNTQASPIDLDPSFATLAINCYADEAGRPTARKSAQQYTTTHGTLLTSAVKRCYRHNKADGTSVRVLAGGGLILTATATTLTDSTAGPYADDYWQFASLNGKIFGVKESTAGVYFADTALTTPVALTTPSSVQFKAIHAAYGRLWAITDTKLYWCDLLDGTAWSSGAFGSIDLQLVQTQMRDIAVAVTSFNGMIAVLCKNSIYVFDMDNTGTASNPQPNPNASNPIRLRDFIPFIGTVFRDSVVSTGDDVLFVSDDGVRSLSRSMAEQKGPAPLTDMSATNKDYVVNNLVRANATTSLTAAWDPERSWYMVFSADTEEVWLFDFGHRMQGSNIPRMFIWRMGTAKKLYCGMWWSDDVMEFGGASGVYRMNTYNASDSYDMQITTGWLSLGGAERLDVFKRMMLNITGGGGQTITLRWYADFLSNSVRSVQFSLTSGQTVYEFGVAEYEDAEYSSGVSTAELYQQIGGSGKVIQLDLTIPVAGTAVTINNSALFYKQGRVR